jgi:tetratricopeptide (TPR) repeat protein
LRTQAVAYKKLGALYGVSKRFEEARGRYAQASVIDERRLAQSPDDTRAKLDLSYDYSDLGWVAGQLGSYAESLTAYQRVLLLRTEAARSDPNDQRAADALASAVRRVGTALRKAGDPEGSERELRRAIALYQNLIQRGWGRRFDLAMTLDDLADSLEALCHKGHRGPSCLAGAADQVHAELAILEQLRAEGRLVQADQHMIAEAKQREDALRHAAR